MMLVASPLSHSQIAACRPFQHRSSSASASTSPRIQTDAQAESAPPPPPPPPRIHKRSAAVPPSSPSLCADALPPIQRRKFHHAQQHTHTQAAVSIRVQPVDATQTQKQTENDARADDSASTPTSAVPLHLQPCAECGSTLQPKQMNLMQQLYMCSDQQCPYPLNSGQLSSFWVSHPILPHLHALLHGDVDLYEYKPQAKPQVPLQTTQLQTPLSGDASLARRTPLLSPTLANAALTTQPIAAAAPLASSHASASVASSSLHVPGSSTVLAALQFDSQNRTDPPALPVPSAAPSATLPPPFHPLSALSAPAPSAADAPASTSDVAPASSLSPSGLSSPSLLPQSDGWGDPALFHPLSSDGAPSTGDDASVQLMIAEMQERQRMEELDQQGLLWE